MGTTPQRILEYYQRCVPRPPERTYGTLLEQRGQIRLGPDRPWMPFTAEQRSDASTTGFVWHARFKMAPLLTGLVVDRYEEGQGRLDARVWGVIPVAHARGPEVDRGEAQRYLAELAWCPMALLHNPELRYRALGPDLVRVWVGEEATHVDLVLDAEGDIVGAKTTTRARGTEVQPWEGRFWSYRDFGGIRAPSRAEVWWETPEGPFVYWRGEVVDLRWDNDGLKTPSHARSGRP